MLARCMPVSICHWVGKLVVLIVYTFSHKDRKGLAINLSLALDRPIDDPLIRKTVRQIFLNYGQYLPDFFLIPQLSPRDIRTFFASIKGEEILKKALAKGKGAILLSAHLGNWEIGGCMLRAMNYPLAIVARIFLIEADQLLILARR
jgi:KDO2-lipid IV(A) lauroyltransferase